MTAVPHLSVLLPTYRQPEILILTLRDLARQAYPTESWELVVMDDGSRDASAQLPFASFTNDVPVTVHRVPSGGRYRHAAVFNELLRLAAPGTHAFVHVEDARLRPDFLRQHAKWHTGGQAKLVTGPMCEGPAETFEPASCFRWDLMSRAGRVQAYRCCFQAVFAKSMSYPAPLRDALTEQGAAGPFDEAMTGWGYHETEFALRASANGAVCVYDTACGIYHPTHQDRDERDYRSIARESARQAGTAQNIEYLCRKHGLDGLPDWEVGVPLVLLPSVGGDMEATP